ncbi:flagellar hook-associated protein FlgL [Brevibacillus centrosporus]|uniref:flagellar hook-associated protein FlgL n=1 Tax=Brevibacillus centrosporus TaxID=54910 RepID=UPI002E2028FC|nr:flagellar hook-associated protein FlgL [Brevibacillus centrosporus]MED4911312.1 flagellar hook-associated protein FlgL [Brevibacillus centrosporus]
MARVTQNMLNSNMLRNLYRSAESMDRLQDQLSSGRKISRPSDDPVVASRAMFYRSSLTENEQFQQNVKEAKGWMDVTDNSLGEATDIFNRVRELVIESNDVSLDRTALEAIGAEIAEIKDHLGNIANQTIGGKYIFAGTDTLHPPFNAATGTFDNTNGTDITLEMGQSIYLPINVNGQEVFNYPNATNNIFNLLDSIATQALNGQPVAQTDLGALDRQIDNVLSVRATLGARMNRNELIEQRLSDQELDITKLKSENEDADAAEVITKLKTQETVYQAALGAGARILQPSLMDYLR